MDIVFINDLRIETIIGIYDWERRVRQTISLDLEMGADIRAAAATDAIEDTLNYKAVAKRLIKFVGESEYQLVETLAEKIAGIVLTVRSFVPLPSSASTIHSGPEPAVKGSCTNSGRTCLVAPNPLARLCT